MMILHINVFTQVQYIIVTPECYANYYYTHSMSTANLANQFYRQFMSMIDFNCISAPRLVFFSDACVTSLAVIYLFEWSWRCPAWCMLSALWEMPLCDMFLMCLNLYLSFRNFTKDSKDLTLCSSFFTCLLIDASTF